MLSFCLTLLVVYKSHQSFMPSIIAKESFWACCYHKLSLSQKMERGVGHLASLNFFFCHVPVLVDNEAGIIFPQRTFALKWLQRQELELWMFFFCWNVHYELSSYYWGSTAVCIEYVYMCSSHPKWQEVVRQLSELPKSICNIRTVLGLYLLLAFSSSICLSHHWQALVTSHLVS